LEFSDVFLIPWTDLETMAPNHPDSRERERGSVLFAATLDLARRLGAPGITMLPGIDWPGESHEESLFRAATELGRRAEAARECGVRLSVEPHAGSVCGSPGDAVRICELAPGLELTVDYTHFVVQGFPQDEIDPLLVHARHFHARGAARGRVQAAMAANEIDYERVVDALRAVNYGGYLAIEYVCTDWEEMNDLDVASETVLMRDRLRAKLAGEPWTYEAPA
jgi:sugar phosphate isomerase/epimerase